MIYPRPCTRSSLLLLIYFCGLSLLLSGMSAFAAPNGQARINLSKQYVHDELLIKLKDETYTTQVDALTGQLGAVSTRSFKRQQMRGVISAEIDRWRLVRFSNQEIDELTGLRERLLRNPNIERVEYNYYVAIDLTPNDPLYPDQWALNNIGQTGGTVDSDIDAPETWDIQTGGNEVVVAVIDTGVDYNHPDLAANMWVNSGEIPANGLDDDGNGYIDDVHGYDFINNDGDPMDDNGHGTHVSGTVAAVGNNGVGVTGVSWNARIMAIKFLSSTGGGTSTDAINAILYATNMGAAIQNNSWGGGGFSQAMQDAIAAADAAGSLFVAAAGNSSSNNDISPHFPSSYTVPNVIAVAATDHNDNLASFSSFGATSVDLAAPGVSILSTALSIPAEIWDPSGYIAINGTSMATPHVSGAAALLMSQIPSLTHLQVKDLLLQRVDVLPSMTGISVTGGRLNVANVVEDDNVAPAAINDLLTTSATAFGIDLTWSGSGDDGLTGQALRYEVYHATQPIDASNIGSATLAGIIGASGPAGTPEFFNVNGLSPNTEYFFVVLAVDNVGNVSELSNLASMSTETVVLAFIDDMDNLLNWQVAGVPSPDGLWHITTHRFNSPGSALYYGIDGVFNYSTGTANFGTSTSIPIDLGFFTNSLLRFNHFVDTEGGGIFDEALVQVSNNGGVTWTTLFTAQPTSGVMVNQAIDLSSYDGQSIQLRFSFDTIDDILNDFEGWVIDDITISGSSTIANIPPIANAGLDQTIPSNTPNIVLNGSNSFDPEGQPLAYLWTQVSGPDAPISGFDSAIANIEIPLVTAPTDLVFNLSVTDDQAESGSDQVIISLLPPNQAPIADAGPSQTVVEGSPVQLDGGASFDPDGTIVSFSWLQTAGPLVQLIGSNTATPSFVAPQVAQATTTLTFELTVTDNFGEPGMASVDIAIENNQPPVAVAGQSQIVDEGDQVFLDGTASFDPDGVIVSYDWIVIQGSGVVLNNPTTATPDFIAPQVIQNNNYIIQLTVTDNNQASSISQVVITVNNVNQLPSAVPGLNQVATSGQPVFLDGSASFDPDGVITAYSWNQIAGTSVTLNNAGLAIADFVAPVLLVAEDLVFELTVTDNDSANNTAAVTVTVQASTPPVITSQPQDVSVNEGGSATFSVAATSNVPLSYQWQRDGVDIVGANTDSFTLLAVTQADNGAIFSCIVSNEAGSVSSIGALLTVSAIRVSAGLLAFYAFNEGSGSVVNDLSGVGEPLNLDISGEASWVPGGGLSADGNALIATAGPASKLINAVTSSNAITVEAWITPTDTSLAGPARVVSLSENPLSRNFTLGQDSTSYDMRLRSTATSNNGLPSISTANGVLATQLSHVVYTRDAAGTATIYVDGNPQATGNIGGNMANWDNSYRLAYGNELSGDRPWQGQFHMAAFYDRALTGTEVTQNFTAGPETGSNQAPVADAGSNQTVVSGSNVSLDGSASFDPDGSISDYFWQQIAGPNVTIMGDNTAVPSFTAPDVVLDTVLTFTLTVTDDSDSSSTDRVDITVTPPLSAPSIITHPADLTVNEGQAASFQVVVAGSSPLSYQWQRDGVDIPGATSSSFTLTPTTLLDNGATFSVNVSNSLDSATSNTAVLTVLPNNRVVAGLQALYEFNEGSGVQVSDTSGVGTPMDLTMSGAATWIPGGVSISSNALIETTTAASKINAAVALSSELSVEAWIKPTDLTLTGPARIVSMSQDPFNRNFTLGQDNNRYDMRLRTTATSTNGTPSLATPAGSLGLQLTHVVYTRDATGVATLYIDGVTQSSTNVGGDVSNWNSSYRFALGNELTGDRPWQGEFHLVALYDRALTTADVEKNFIAGSGSGGNLPPTAVATGPAIVISGDSVQLDGSTSIDPEGGILSFSWQQISGPAAFAGSNLVTPSFTAPPVAVDTLIEIELTVTDDASASGTDTIAITVTPPATPPSIVTQPIDVTVTEGQSAQFSLQASGTAPLTFQWQRDGVDIPGANSNSLLLQSTTLTDNGATFSCIVSNNLGAVVTNTVILTVLPSVRVTDGLQARYDFNEGQGNTVLDNSGVGTPLNLSINGLTSWTANGLLVNGSALISSGVPATKLNTAITASSAISVEAWITSSSTSQSGPARIVTLSDDTINRNFTLGQDGTVYNARLRTTSTSNNGIPAVSTSTGILTTALTHIVYTRDAAGVVKVYIDGIEQASNNIGGDLSNWDSTYQLALANELSNDRPWLGEFHLVAIYSKALSQAEVDNNFNAGH